MSEEVEDQGRVELLGLKRRRATVQLKLAFLDPPDPPLEPPAPLLAPYPVRGGEDGVSAFTETGIANPRQIIADERAAGRAPPPVKPAE